MKHKKSATQTAEAAEVNVPLTITSAPSKRVRKTVKPVVDSDPTTLAELLVAFKKMQAAQTAALPAREEPVDRSFIDQFHERLCALERNNGTLSPRRPEYPHPDDDASVTRETPTAETFDLKENAA
jgi:hypothetical protein